MTHYIFIVCSLLVTIQGFALSQKVIGLCEREPKASEAAR